MDKVAKFFDKKIAGVKVLYLALVAVLILAYYAWRTTRTSALDDVGAVEGEEFDDSPERAQDLAQYGAILPRGTVYVTTPTEPEIDGDVPDDTNDAWLRRGVEYLVSAGLASPGVAQTALQKALSGGDLSYSQGQLYDAVVREQGLPPTNVPLGGIGGAPAPAPTPTPKPAAKKSTGTAPTGPPTVTGITSGGATAVVPVPTNTSSKITEYQVRVSGDRVFNSADRIYTSTSNRVPVKFGHPDKPYYLIARTRNASGLSKWSTVTATRSGKTNLRK